VLARFAGLLLRICPDRQLCCCFQGVAAAIFKLHKRTAHSPAVPRPKLCVPRCVTTTQRPSPGCKGRARGGVMPSRCTGHPLQRSGSAHGTPACLRVGEGVGEGQGSNRRRG
jgi:hypothetical protein